MENKLNNDSDNNKESNFQNFVKVQKEIIESSPISSNIVTTLTFDELFKFFCEHFNEFRQDENICVVLPFVHRCVKVWCSQGDRFEHDIGIALTYFLEDHKDSENDLNVVIKIVYQILNSVKCCNNETIISQKLICHLIELLPTIRCRSLVSNIIVCVQLYLNMYKESCEVLLTLWTDLSQRLQTNINLNVIKNTEIDILVQLYDEFQSVMSKFYDDPILVGTIRQLIESDQRADRRRGYYLLNKVSNYLIKSISCTGNMWISSHQVEQTKQSWIMYITLLENLEEGQSHLILPSLTSLQELVERQQIHQTWLDILYLRLLTYNNTLVLRWVIEFLLKTFSCSNLCTRTLKHLIAATNSNLLYNYEGYFLNLNSFSSFLNDDLIKIYMLLPKTENWKSIPLYIWLEELNKKELPKSVTFQLVLEISACVRKLQNVHIRQKAIIVCNKLFSSIIEKMSMEEYITYIKTLYNSTDQFYEHALFFNKTSTNQKQNFFDKRFYDIFTSTAYNQVDLLKLGSLYNLHFNYNQLALSEFLVHIKDQLLVNDNFFFEIKECEQVAISLYISQLINLEEINDNEWKIILIAGLNKNCFERVAELLEVTNKQLELWIIIRLIERISSQKMVINILRFLNKHYEQNVVNTYTQTILEKHPSFFPPSSIIKDLNILKHINNANYFNGPASKGNSRIEQAFCFYHFGIFESDARNMKQIWLNAIHLTCDKEYVLYLLKYHKHITKKKERYFDNSNEHRIKLRIAIGILKAFLSHKFTCDELFDEIWDIILNENNQLNVLYIYEYILGTYDKRVNVILEKLELVHSLTSSKQVSIISVAYTFCSQLSLCYKTHIEIVTSLLALAMGANFQVRLFAQMSLFKLIKYGGFDMFENAIYTNFIQNCTRVQLQYYLDDIRIQIKSLAEMTLKKTNFDLIDIILFVTNAPFDEIINTSFKIDDMEDDLLKNQIIKCRDVFMKKIKETDTEEVTIECLINNQIQRKTNPANNLTESSDLLCYPIKVKSAEMYVVASLVNKLPNLGGIARTCEVLGIKNLVIDSKTHLENNDFKNLSMTAEKSLNIFEVKSKDLKEYLMNKKLEGFKIVGAEQTSNSQNFNNFKFPQKCVLLLGDEKNGIPAHLLGLLDYAVEIPQFGQVRSLNVHVTSALFMWEYCKQHLMQQQ